MSSNPWECPRCNKINAPWLPHCYCVPKEKTQSEKMREIIGEKWVLMFTDDTGEVFQGIVSNHENIPAAIKNVFEANGYNIYLEDRTPWRNKEKNLSVNKNTAHIRQQGYNPNWCAHCPICFEMLNGLTAHQCKGKQKA